MKGWHIYTKCVQEGWKPKNGEPRVLPIVQSTTFKYDSSETMGFVRFKDRQGFLHSPPTRPPTRSRQNRRA